ncbi:hypothetical protein [Haliangium sp. UPWRP_2]|jgi:hypothetical protein|uniref:hypothetical protein n=1 Tax=Haliangium sp. UPWRP_2 TaxID=1931276 RepID=UPI000B543DE5|nr:hypothetical protein [Haliangium sp. UPWRP_2]PSM31163.1 hypothetical protein BVG81_006775 [Haliangium sp. UPWRP_2]
MSYSAQVKVMTTDPGARFLGGVADDLKTQFDALKARVDACCDDGPSPLAPLGDAKIAAPGAADTKVR